MRHKECAHGRLVAVAGNMFYRLDEVVEESDVNFDTIDQSEVKKEEVIDEEVPAVIQ